MTNELEKERPFGTHKSLPLYSQPPKLSVLAILLLLYISLRDTLGSLTLSSMTIKSCCDKNGFWYLSRYPIVIQSSWFRLQQKCKVMIYKWKVGMYYSVNFAPVCLLFSSHVHLCKLSKILHKWSSVLMNTKPS